MPFSTYIDYNYSSGGLYNQLSSAGEYETFSSESNYTKVIVFTASNFSFEVTATNSYSNKTGGTASFNEFTVVNNDNSSTFSSAFIPSVGFELNNNGEQSTIYFSDEIGNIPLTQSTTSQISSSLNIASTTSKTLSTTIDDVSTTWTDVTSTASSHNILYTDVLSNEILYIGIEEVGTANSFIGQSLFICPSCGPEWTLGKNNIQTINYFSSTGSALYSDGIKLCETNAKIAILAETELIYGNADYPANQDTTIFPESNVVVSYEYTEIGTSSSFITIASNQLEYSNGKFTINTDADTAIQFYKKTIKSSSTSYNLRPLVVYGSAQSYGSINLYTATKIISVPSTGTFNCIDSFYSYFSSFTYAGFITTTAISSYILFNYGHYGSMMESTSGSTATETQEANEIGAFTESGSTQYSSSISASFAKISTIAYKSYYTLPLGATNDEWNKSYTKKVGNFNFVVEDANSANKFVYYKNFVPTQNLTKCYFTDYEYERVGAYKKAKFYVPVSTYVENSDETIIHNVSIPSGYYFGEDSAIVSISKIYSSTSSTESLFLCYSDIDSLCSMGYDGINDFSVFQSPPFMVNAIFHTEPSFYHGSWKKDGYYYYSSSIRTYSNTANNPISIDGDGAYKTFVGSEYVFETAFPVATVVGIYVNSF